MRVIPPQRSIQIYSIILHENAGKKQYLSHLFQYLLLSRLPLSSLSPAAGFQPCFVEYSCVISSEREVPLLKSFFLPIGASVGASLPSVLSALSCGAALPVSNLDILHVSDREADPLPALLVRDLNQAHALLADPENVSLFPSSFIFDFCRPQLPSGRSLSEDASAAALLDALRGRGLPLSYKTDREAVEWAFSALLSDPADPAAAPLFAWFERLRSCLDSGEAYRVALACDLCDAFSAGAAFAVLRYLSENLSADPACVSLFALAFGSEETGVFNSDALSASLRALADPSLIAGPGEAPSACAGSVWLLSLPSSLYASRDSLRVLYAVFARQLARFCVSDKLPAPGLHTVSLPGVLTLRSLDEQAASFAAFLHAAAWLLCDLLPAFRAFSERPAPPRSLSGNTRNGLFRRLAQGKPLSPERLEQIPVLDRALRAVLSEVLSLIRFLPAPLRLASVSDPLWQRMVDACGRTVTVAAEYAVSHDEAEEGGFLGAKPVHRVSLADTFEEIADRRLEDIAAQLKDEEENRARLFRSAGGCWAVLALRDCRARCADALSRARDQQSAGAQSADRVSAAALARRVRLLEAAVARCDADLADPALLSPRPDEAPAAPDDLRPFDGEILAPAAAEKLSFLLSASGDAEAQARKDLQALLPSLLSGFTLPEVKLLFRSLLSVCAPDPAADPFALLLLSVLRVSREETASLRFLSAGDVPPVPLLPDLFPAKPPLAVSTLLPLLPASAETEAALSAAKRGLLALLFLRVYRRRLSEEASLSFRRLEDGASPVLHAWLSARGASAVWIVSLEQENITQPFALILPGRDLLPARITAAHAALLPLFAAPWFDPESASFLDPCALLGEGNRAVLLDRFSALLSSGALEDPLRSFLNDFRRDLLAAAEQASVPDRLALRLRASFGLRLLPAFRAALVRSACPYERSLLTDDLAARLADRSSFAPAATVPPDDVVYLYRDIPFARESARTLLEAIPLPAEKWILSLLEQECKILSRASDDYHDALTRELPLLLNRCPDAAPEARQIALDLLEEAKKPVPEQETELSWPWDPKSPSVLTILTESLGEGLAAAALQPFSEKLALFPARGSEVVGDSLLGAMCQLSPRVSSEETEGAAPVQADAVLPPLSGGLCAALCRLPEGRALFRPGLLSFDRAENNAVRVTLTLQGTFPVRLVRLYAEEEILHLYAHDIPTLAVWPDLPFAPEDWKAYFTYASLPASFRVSVYTASGETALPDAEASRRVCRSEEFPLAFSFAWEDSSVGALPNLLPSPEIEKTDPVTACVDFGSVGTSVVFAVGRQRKPLQGPTLVRTLLNNPAASRELLRKEFLPAVPVSALLPTASRVFRNVPGAAPLPFEDGVVLMAADLQDALSIPSGALYTCLKWEEEKGRSVTLCLHQIMLMAALQARYDGASALLWRFAVPDEMAREGRERLVSLFSSLAETVCAEAGFAPPEKQPPVTFAQESSALGAYFRFCASEDTRGGFMVLDIGACTADISLFLRGREQAVRTCQIPLGVHYMLLPSLLRDPDLLERDLGFIADPAFRRDLSLLRQVLRNAGAEPSALRHSRLALDNFLADRYVSLLPALLQSPATGMPTRLGSVFLLHFSFLLMLSGLILLQISTDHGMNDFLPEQMSLCLSGRGSLLPEALPDPYKKALWHFLTMFRNRRVAALSFLFSSEKKMEIPVGLSLLESVSADLPPASAAPAAISVRPEELLPQFILRFAQEFPASAEVLFHGFFTGDFYHPFTPSGESLISEAISQSFTDQTALRPFDALSAWITSLLELLDHQ